MKSQRTARVVLVTGAGSGIGRASARAFARAGAAVIVNDIDPRSGAETVDMVQAEGGFAAFVHADVSVAEEVERLFHVIDDSFGRLDAAHNNAGILGPHDAVADIEISEWDRVISTNLRSVFLCIKYEVGLMARRGGGCIVNTASRAGLVGFPGSSAYAASKHGVVGLTRSAASEYARFGIRINALCPGRTRTTLLHPYLDETGGEEALAESIPLGRLGEPEEIAAATVWLCSDAASFVVGAAVPIDGGMSA
jgi:NAD(P)-dependent dehydrogenase (short-subunit alcohol dehydrogenase family)